MVKNRTLNQYFTLDQRSKVLVLRTQSLYIKITFMRLVLPSFLAISLIAPSAFAALATDADTAVAFFRNKQSLFPSGQVSRTSLEDKLLNTETEISFTATWDNKQFNLQADQLIRDLHVARFVVTNQNTSLFSLNTTTSTPIKNLAAKASLEILAVEDMWARVKERSGTLQGWVPLYALENTYDDPGVFINLVDTFLRLEPRPGSAILTTIPRLRRVVPLEVTKNFLKIQYEDRIGFADITQFLSRADFATLAYHPQKNWMPVLYRNNNTVVTKSGESIPLKEILGYVTNSRRGVIKKSDGITTPPIRARVEISKHEAHVWALSDIKGHGKVWWKKQDLLVEAKKSPNVQTLTTEELLKREIQSIAFESSTSVRGLVSSEGIYRTEDGQTWTLIPQFGKDNYPVSIHPNGTWFVGSFRSKNQGKSFEPFIRWDKIAKAIESAYHRNPRYLKLTKIEALPDSKVVIHVDTGNYKVKLRSLIGDLNWDVIKN